MAVGGSGRGRTPPHVMRDDVAKTFPRSSVLKTSQHRTLWNGERSDRIGVGVGGMLVRSEWEMLEQARKARGSAASRARMADRE